VEDSLELRCNRDKRPFLAIGFLDIKVCAAVL
jgi:hypothetical protein